jgi:hypothetical protein
MDIGIRLIVEIEPGCARRRIPRDRRGAMPAGALRHHTGTVACRMRFRVGAPHDMTPRKGVGKHRRTAPAPYTSSGDLSSSSAC